MRDLRATADNGRLDIDDPRTSVAMVDGALFGVLHLLETRPDLDAAHVSDQLAFRLLRMFGMTCAEARAIATRTLATAALDLTRAGGGDGKGGADASPGRTRALAGGGTGPV